jgi:hypothetical protein
MVHGALTQRGSAGWYRGVESVVIWTIKLLGLVIAGEEVAIEVNSVGQALMRRAHNIEGTVTKVGDRLSFVIAIGNSPRHLTSSDL